MNFWINDLSAFENIKYPEFKFSIKVGNKKNQFFLLYDFYCHFFKSAEYLAENICNNYGDNHKTDTWTLPAIYLYRQALELLVKALAAKKIDSKNLPLLFQKYKHNIFGLFSELNLVFEATVEDERQWLLKFLQDIEIEDVSSDLFRYSFSDNFLKKCGGKCLDSCNIFNSFNIAIEILHSYFIENKQTKIHEVKNFLPTLIQLCGTGIGCDPCTRGSSKLYKQITGYTEAADYLFSLADNKLNNVINVFFPMAYLFRHSIELYLKQMIFMELNEKLDGITVHRIKNSHRIKKDLWNCFYPVLEKYREDGQDIGTLQLADKYLSFIDDYDKQGDVFRYPISKSLELYNYFNKTLDLKNIHTWFSEITNFLYSVDAWLDHINEMENEMRSYYSDF